MGEAMSTSAVWFEIYVRDTKRARKFYETLFNVTLRDYNLGSDRMSPGKAYWAFPENSPSRPESGEALVKMPDTPSGSGSSIVYFTTDDCGRAARRAVELGGKLFKAKYAIGDNGNVALVWDTEGNLIGFHSMY